MKKISLILLAGALSVSSAFAKPVMYEFTAQINSYNSDPASPCQPPDGVIRGQFTISKLDPLSASQYVSAYSD